MRWLALTTWEKNNSSGEKKAVDVFYAARLRQPLSNNNPERFSFFSFFSFPKHFNVPTLITQKFPGRRKPRKQMEIDDPIRCFKTAILIRRVRDNLHTYLVHILTVTLFLKSLGYKYLPHAQRVSHDCLSILRYLLSSRACFTCHTSFPGTIEKKYRRKKKSILYFQRFGRLSFDFFAPAG